MNEKMSFLEYLKFLGKLSIIFLAVITISAFVRMNLFDIKNNNMPDSTSSATHYYFYPTNPNEENPANE